MHSIRTKDANSGTQLWPSFKSDDGRISIVVFAGAGASKAVDPGSYPTTVEFYKKLTQPVRNDRLFREIDSYLKGPESSAALDIEVILWELQNLKKILDDIVGSKSLAGHLCKGARLPNSLGLQNRNFGNMDEIFGNSINKIDNLTSLINTQVYDLYGAAPPEDRLDETWRPLIKGLKSITECVEIVTTNYDVVIESACAGRDWVDFGWKDGVYRILETAEWQREPNKGKGLLTKLHGSVNWAKATETSEKIFVSDPGFRGKDCLHTIIYPGFKGRASEQPFALFHDRFRDTLRSAAAVVFVGFAFRDDHINEICERNIKPNTPVVIINPVRGPLPFDGHSEHFIEAGFDPESVRDALSFLKEILT